MFLISFVAFLLRIIFLEYHLCCVQTLNCAYLFYWNITFDYIALFDDLNSSLELIKNVPQQHDFKETIV